MRKPIEKFESDKQLEEALAEWKSILMLDSWTLVARLTPIDELKESGGEQCIGESQVNYISKNSYIRIADGKYVPVMAERFCAEQTLVHELLHCKYNILKDEETYEGVILDVHQHQLLEEMSKSLMMARYELPFDYWKHPFWNTEFSYGDS